MANKQQFILSKDETEYSLREAVELYALGICENIAKDEKRTEDIERSCKILDSLSMALISINS